MGACQSDTSPHSSGGFIGSFSSNGSSKKHPVNPHQAGIIVHSTITDGLDYNHALAEDMPLELATDEQLLAEMSIRRLDVASVDKNPLDVSTHSFYSEMPLAMVSDDHLSQEIWKRHIDVRDVIDEESVHEIFEFVGRIGAGASATVLSCTHRESGLSYACKIIEKNATMNDALTMSTELEIMKRVMHENVVTLFEVFESCDRVWLMLEMVEGCSLKGLLDTMKGDYTEKIAANHTRQILCGLKYLHSIGVVHRDLKAENILVKQVTAVMDGPDEGLDSSKSSIRTIEPTQFQIKIADFGLSALLGIASDGTYVYPDQQRRTRRHPLEGGFSLLESLAMKRKSFDGLTEAWGTNEYQAPEQLLKSYGPQIDMWALGCIVYEMLSGSLAFPKKRNEQNFDLQKDRIMRRQLNFSRPRLVAASAEAKDFLLRLLVICPRKRLNAEEGLQQRWIRKYHTPQALRSFNTQGLRVDSTLSGSGNIRRVGSDLGLTEMANSLDSKASFKLRRKSIDNFDAMSPKFFRSFKRSGSHVSLDSIEDCSPISISESGPLRKFPSSRPSKKSEAATNDRLQRGRHSFDAAFTPYTEAAIQDSENPPNYKHAGNETFPMKNRSAIEKRARSFTLTLSGGVGNGSSRNSKESQKSLKSGIFVEDGIESEDEVDAAKARVAQESQSAWRIRNRFSTRVEKEMPASSSAPILLSLRDPSSESYRGDAVFTLANTAASSSAEGWTEALSGTASIEKQQSPL